MMKSTLLALLAAAALMFAGCEKKCEGDCATEANATTEEVAAPTEITDAPVAEATTNEATAGTDTLETPATTPAQ